MENEYLTTQEVIKSFRVTKTTLLKLIREGRIRAFRIGNAYRFKKAELEEDLRVSRQPDEPKAAAK